MSTSRLQQSLNHFRQLLIQHNAAAEQQLDNAYKSVLENIQASLNNLYDQMIGELGKGEKLPATWLLEANRLENIKKLINNEVSHYGLLSKLSTSQQMHFASQLGQQAGMQLLQSTVPAGVHYTFGVPSPAAMQNIVGVTNAGPLADLFNSFGPDASKAVATALLTGVSLGWNPRRIAPLVDQALGVPRWRALTIARNSMLQAYKTSNLETFRANSDIVQQWRWQAARQGRTCAVCIAMDGTLHDISEDFDSHVQCRCVPVPITKSWEDILGARGSDIPETSAGVGEYQSGSDWFAEQDESLQRQVLGNAKFAAYQAGALDLSDLIGVSHSDDWGTSRYEKSLADVLGSKKAKQYYSGS